MWKILVSEMKCHGAVLTFVRVTWTVFRRSALETGPSSAPRTPGCTADCPAPAPRHGTGGPATTAANK